MRSLICACRQRILDVILEAIFRGHHSRDAALGISAIALLDIVFGYDQDPERRRNLQRGTQPRDAGADDQDIGEKMRRVLGMKWYQVAAGEDHEAVAPFVWRDSDSQHFAATTQVASVFDYRPKSLDTGIWATFLCKSCAKHTPLWLHRNDASCTETHLLHRKAQAIQKCWSPKGLCRFGHFSLFC
jgi:hypothetical protein